MRLILTLILSAVASASLAEAMHLFKQVHADGSVSYSDTRAGAEGQVEAVSIQLESAVIEQQGGQRLEQIEAYNQNLEKQRAEQAKSRSEYQTRVAEARQQVVDAERNLKEAQQSKKSATPERIKAHQEQLKLARQRLREVEGGAR